MTLHKMFPIPDESDDEILSCDEAFEEIFDSFDRTDVPPERVQQRSAQGRDCSLGRC